ncbi:MAG: DUF1778 domain-containing protein [Sedimenticolaceae bacterium]
MSIDIPAELARPRGATLSLRVSPETKRALQKIARARGITVTDLVTVMAAEEAERQGVLPKSRGRKKNAMAWLDDAVEHTVDALRPAIREQLSHGALLAMAAKEEGGEVDS